MIIQRTYFKYCGDHSEKVTVDYEVRDTDSIKKIRDDILNDMNNEDYLTIRNPN